MMLTYEEALVELANKEHTIESITELVEKVSGKLYEAADGEVTHLLYTGKINDETYSNKLASQISDLKSENVRQVADSHVGKLLKSKGFSDALTPALKFAVFGDRSHVLTLDNVKLMVKKEQLVATPMGSRLAFCYYEAEIE